MKAGQRDTVVTIEIAGEPEDNTHGDEIPTWSEHAKEWAEYRPGTGAERRQAAQESASLVGTFRMLSNPRTQSIRPGNFRLIAAGYTWDITSAVPLGRDAVEVTAVAAVTG